jgi:hypothetical protein
MNIKKFANRFRNSKWITQLLGPIWYPIKHRKKKQDYKNHALEALILAKKSIDSAGLFFWLDFGTLLGAYREKDFIKHDLDIDISMFAKDSEEAKKIMIKAGFILMRTFEVPDEPHCVEQTYDYKGVNLDIFFYVEEGDLMSCNLFYWHAEDDYLFGNAKEAAVQKVICPNTGFSTIMFKEHVFNVPKDIIKYLTVNYGPNFMKPDKKFDRFKQCRNVTYYSKLEKIGIYTKYE